MYYYTCKRCGHYAKQKIEMKRHLDKKVKCDIKDNDNKMTGKELYDNSLIRQNYEIIKNNDYPPNVYECNIILDHNFKKDNQNKDSLNKDTLDKDTLDNDSYKITDVEIITINNEDQNNTINTDNVIKLIDKDNDNYCSNCDKYFLNKSNLNKHKRNVCENTVKIEYKKQKDQLKKDKINNVSIQNNIEFQNNNNNNNNNVSIQNNNVININIQCLRGFDEEWDVSLISEKIKSDLLLSNAKFTKTLQEIMNNRMNLNVIMDKDEKDVGIVYKMNKNKYEIMSKKEINETSIKKIYKHLKDFYVDIITNNELEISEVALNNEKKVLDEKYELFFNREDIQDKVSELLTDIYHNKKEEAQVNYNDFNNIKDMIEF